MLSLRVVSYDVEKHIAELLMVKGVPVRLLTFVTAVPEERGLFIHRSSPFRSLSLFSVSSLSFSYFFISVSSSVSLPLSLLSSLSLLFSQSLCDSVSLYLSVSRSRSLSLFLPHHSAPSTNHSRMRSRQLHTANRAHCHVSHMLEERPGPAARHPVRDVKVLCCTRESGSEGEER